MSGTLINQLVQGVLLGGLYTLFATGLSLTAGVMRFINIAHGDFIVLACFALLTLTTTLGLNPVLASILVLPIAFAIGFTLQRYLLQRVAGELGGIRRGAHLFGELQTRHRGRRPRAGEDCPHTEKAFRITRG